MKFSKQKTKNLRMLVFLNSKSIREFIAWIVLFLLATGFYVFALYNRFEDQNNASCDFLNFIVFKNCEMTASVSLTEAIIAVLKTTLIYTILLMIPVYINLKYFGKYILENKKLRIFTYVPYLVLILANAFIFAWLMQLIARAFPEILNKEIKIWFNALIIFGTQLIATGLWFRRLLMENLSDYKKVIKREIDSRRKLKELKEKLHEIKIKGVKEYIKVGRQNKYWIIRIKDIRFLQADGNEPKIFTDDEKGVYRGSSSLTDHSKFLPENLFLQVHRSYIVMKSKVMARRGDALILRGTKEVIPIGNTYRTQVDNDEILGFLGEIKE